jgi:transcriptional regulator with XRE-family HTH domain
MSGLEEINSSTIGGSVRSARLLKRLTLKELAELAGCSESLLSKIENGLTSPSIVMLQRIARGLNVGLAALVTPMEQARPVSLATERVKIPTDTKGSYVERLVSPDGDHLLEGHMHYLAPGAGILQDIAHHGEEVGYVVEGRFRLFIGIEIFDLKVGDSFNFRSEISHRYINNGKGFARILWISTPGRQVARPGQRKLKK